MGISNSNNNNDPAIPPLKIQEVRTFTDYKLLTPKQLDELTVEETQQIFIEDPPGDLD